MIIDHIQGGAKQSGTFYFLSLYIYKLLIYDIDNTYTNEQCVYGDRESFTEAGEAKCFRNCLVAQSTKPYKVILYVLMRFFASLYNLQFYVIITFSLILLQQTSVPVC